MFPPIDRLRFDTQTADPPIRPPDATPFVVARASMATSAFPAPKLFDYETVTSNLSVADAIESVEAAFGALAKGKVDVRFAIP